MKLSRIVIERIPNNRQKAAMPDADIDQRVESQTPISCWMDIMEAWQLAGYLRTFYPLLADDTGAILLYAMQECEWPDDSIPPAPQPFDLAAVGRAHASFKMWMPQTGPSFGVHDWTVIKDALNAVRGDGQKEAQRVVRAVRGHIANMVNREADQQKAGVQ